MVKTMVTLPTRRLPSVTVNWTLVVPSIAELGEPVMGSIDGQR